MKWANMREARTWEGGELDGEVAGSGQKDMGERVGVSKLVGKVKRWANLEEGQT